MLEHEARAGFRRSELEDDMRPLARSAVLLDVADVDACGPRQRRAIRDERLSDRHLHAVLGLELLRAHVEVQLAHARE